ncbi:uncharacterized protein LOC115651442 isoform X1 [Gopherus evgoodei]|uniref:uncharacterized protein LOC115651442 isoform X1 n=1 Tax=Gopherus evgoodei TaxID=1825980 RepID=UPI0011CF42DA|nr:uncharacterized protein LOC115651442 isoform X1 [Gopherus evgoodei]
MSLYKTPTDAKKPELPLGAPDRVQKRRLLYSCFANEKGLLSSPVFYSERELKKEEPQPFIKNQVRKNLLSDLEKTELKAEGGMEEEPIYEDMATEEQLQDSDVENQPIDPELWKDGDIVTITKPGPYKITALVCNKLPTVAETETPEEAAETMIDEGDSETKDTNGLSMVKPKEHDKEDDMGFNGASVEDDDNSESDEGKTETSSEDEKRRPLSRTAVICTCCFCVKQDVKKKSVKSEESDQKSGEEKEDAVMVDIVRAVVVKAFYHCLKKQLLENCAACAVNKSNPFSHPCIFWDRSEVFYQLRCISSKLNVAQLVNVIIAEGYKLKKLNITTETITKVVKMIREVGKSSDPVALLVDLSKEVAPYIGRAVCSRVRQMDYKTFYMQGCDPRGLKNIY